MKKLTEDNKNKLYRESILYYYYYLIIKKEPFFEDSEMIS